MSPLLRMVFGAAGVVYLLLAGWLTPAVLHHRGLPLAIWLFLVCMGAFCLCLAVLAAGPPRTENKE